VSNQRLPSTFRFAERVAIGIRPIVGVSSNSTKKTKGSIKKEVGVIKPFRTMVVTRTFSDGRTNGQSDDGRGGIHDLDTL
jgi:hypothetical protein